MRYLPRQAGKEGFQTPCRVNALIIGVNALVIGIYNSVRVDELSRFLSARIINRQESMVGGGLAQRSQAIEPVSRLQAIV
jgi:hypothetical protein